MKRYSKPIVIACKEAPERLPPILTLLIVAAELFPEVFLITNRTSDATEKELKGMGINVIQAYKTQKDIKGTKGVIGKVGSWLAFRKRFWSTKKNIDKDAYVWIATADSALAIGKALLKQHYILGLLELYDTQTHYLKLLKPYVQRAIHVVTPEACRSAIFRVWFGLPYTPTVVPNKPIGLNVSRMMPITNENAKKQMEIVGDRKLLLYQARMVRMETFDIAESIKSSLGEDYVLGILGEIRDREMFLRLKNFYPDLIHFDYLRPPEHLAVTSHAYIGLLIYNYESLNNIFCAPNKVWEYGAVSLPMICHELPMLSQLLKQHNAGETFIAGNPDSVTQAVKRIDQRYEAYASGARSLYDSVDIKEVVCSIIDKYYPNSINFKYPGE